MKRKLNQELQLTASASLSVPDSCGNHPIQSQHLLLISAASLGNLTRGDTLLRLDLTWELHLAASAGIHQFPVLGVCQPQFDDVAFSCCLNCVPHLPDAASIESDVLGLAAASLQTLITIDSFTFSCCKLNKLIQNPKHGSCRYSLCWVVREHTELHAN